MNDPLSPLPILPLPPPTGDVWTLRLVELTKLVLALSPAMFIFLEAIKKGICG